MQPYQLPVAVKVRCLEIVKDLDLQFGAIDLIKTPDGRYVFLEINPNGQWAWLDSVTLEPISNVMASLLIKGLDKSSQVE